MKAFICTGFLVLLASCKDASSPTASSGGGGQCSPIGSWKLRVEWNKEGKCEMPTDGEGMRIWVSKGWDGALAVQKGSKLGESNIEAELVEVNGCEMKLTSTTGDRDEQMKTVTFEMKQAGDKLSGAAFYVRKEPGCRQQGRVTGEKI